VGPAAIVAGWAGEGAAAAIGAAPIAIAATAAASIGVMVFNPIRMVEFPLVVYVPALPGSRVIGPAALPLVPIWTPY
jgi:hypothetical protein